MTGNACRRAAALVLAMLVLLAASGCDENASLDTGEQLANPITEYGSYEELCDALGFPMARLQYVGLVPATYASIDGKLGEIFYQGEDETVQVTLREQQGVDKDVSGVYGATYEEQNMQGIDVHIGSAGDTQVAYFTVGGNSYSLSATGVGNKDFAMLADALLSSMQAG